jgi:hypothetical protein
VVEWPTGHSPFASRPDLVVDLLIDLAGGPDDAAALQRPRWITENGDGAC